MIEKTSIEEQTTTISEFETTPVDLDEHLRSQDFAITLAHLLNDLNADDIAVLDISRLTTIADFFVIGSAKSPLHLKSMANDINEILKDNGVKSNHIEGLLALKWILIDYSDVVIHLFLPQTREYYGLESYWHDAERVEIHEDEQ